MAGDIVEDSILERNAAMMERFNITIPEATNADYGTCSTYLKNSVNSGDDIYDLYLSHAIQAGVDALNGWFINWYDINYMNFEQQWYPQRAIESLTIDGKMFLSVSDMAISATENTYCMFYDKVKAESYNLGDIYGMVNNGKWTIDQLITLTKDIYEYLDSSGSADENDYYGFTSNCFSNSNTYLWVFNQPVVEVTDDLTVNITYNCEKTIAIIEKFRNCIMVRTSRMYLRTISKAMNFSGQAMPFSSTASSDTRYPITAIMKMIMASIRIRSGMRRRKIIIRWRTEISPS